MRGFCKWDMCRCYRLCKQFQLILSWESGGLESAIFITFLKFTLRLLWWDMIYPFWIKVFIFILGYLSFLDKTASLSFCVSLCLFFRYKLVLQNFPYFQDTSRFILRFANPLLCLYPGVYFY